MVTVQNVFHLQKRFSKSIECVEFVDYDDEKSTCVVTFSPLYKVSVSNNVEIISAINQFIISCDAVLSQSSTLGALKVTFVVNLYEI